MKNNNKKPNILFIMADQLSASALPCYGNKTVITPNLSKMAEEGIVFENNYCNYPLCAPSRASMMTGRLTSRIGSFDNGAELPASIPTFAHHLRAEGYYTCISGKMHFLGPDQYHGFEDRLTTEIYPADLSWTPNWDPEAKKYSFETGAGMSDIGTMLDSGKCQWSMQMEYDEEVFANARAKLYDFAKEGSDQPFLFVVSFTQPHDPFLASEKYWNMYEHDKIPMPTVSPIPYEEQDPQSQLLYRKNGMDRYDVPEEAVRNARHAYYAMITDIDEKIGELLNILKKTGLDENTIVVFTSDHGEMLGERGIWYKKTLFEDAVKVPLLISAPERFSPKRIKENVSLVDLLPTLVDFAGGDVKEFQSALDGASLTGLINGTGEWEDVVYCDHSDNATVAPRFMVRKGNFKYVFCEAYPAQLYDLEKDPNELNNVAGDPQYSNIEKELKELVYKKWDVESLREKMIFSQKERRLVTEAMSRGRWVSWEIGTTVDPAKHYVRYGDAFPDIERKNYVLTKERDFKMK